MTPKEIVSELKKLVNKKYGVKSLSNKIVVFSSPIDVQIDIGRLIKRITQENKL